MEIILGSNSPRRKELLELLGYKFKVVSPNVDENVDNTNLVEMVEEIASRKAYSLSNNYKDCLIICADTIVVVDNMYLGKPKDSSDAFSMIKKLQNNVHQVYTAVVVIYKDKKYQFTSKTDVYVDPITETEIHEYISTIEPYDKAGGYGIQGQFARYIERIDGDYYNVMGLPISKLDRLIKEIKNSHN